jgi:hypothetical protein
MSTSIGALLFKDHDDEHECKKFQIEFRDSLDRFYYHRDYGLRKAVLLTYQHTTSYWPPGCPAPVPSPLKRTLEKAFAEPHGG